MSTSKIKKKNERVNIRVRCNYGKTNFHVALLHNGHRIREIHVHLILFMTDTKLKDDTQAGSS